jgi:hypothetical protein
MSFGTQKSANGCVANRSATRSANVRAKISERLGVNSRSALSFFNSRFRTIRPLRIAISGYSWGRSFGLFSLGVECERKRQFHHPACLGRGGQNGQPNCHCRGRDADTPARNTEGLNCATERFEKRHRKLTDRSTSQLRRACLSAKERHGPSRSLLDARRKRNRQIVGRPPENDAHWRLAAANYGHVYANRA